MYDPKQILVTGGCGFIGSQVVNLLVNVYPNMKIIVIDKISYCSRIGNINNLDNVLLFQTDINNSINILEILSKYEVDTILHFAASSHVQNSFSNIQDFIHDNIQGTTSLLEVCRKYGKIKRFIHVSTDEVYGEVSHDEISGCTENSVLNPTNPYAATKMAAEALVNAYAKSYKIPIIITRGNNVYGQGQYPEKLIPRFIMLLLNNKPLTIQGDGTATRTFIHVEDVARAFLTIMQKGIIGEIYNIGSNNEKSVLQISQLLSDKIYGKKDALNTISIKDRDFNDQRYHINSDKLYKLGWKEEIPFDDGIEKTIKFYLDNKTEYDFKLF